MAARSAGAHRGRAIERAMRNATKVEARQLKADADQIERDAKAADGRS